MFSKLSVLRLLSVSLLIVAGASSAGDMTPTHSDKRSHSTADTSPAICYNRLSDAYSALNAQQMAQTYAPDGYYISAGKKNSIIQGQQSLKELYQHYFAKVEKYNSSLDIKFRVIDRLIDSKTIIDIGYYLVSVTPPQESKQPVRQHAGKFLITFKQMPDGKWAIWADSNNEVKLEEYINAKPVAALHYDHYSPAPEIAEHIQ